MTEQVAPYRCILKSSPIIGGASVSNLVIDLVQSKNRDQRRLSEAGIPTAVHYPISLNLQPAFAHLNKPAGSFPISEEKAKQVMSLPIGPDLTCNVQQRVVDTLLNAAAPSEMIT